MYMRSFPRISAPLLSLAFTALVVACTPKPPSDSRGRAAQPNVDRAAGVRSAEDTLGLSGLSVDDFPPPTEDLAIATDSLLVEGVEPSDTVAVSYDTFFIQAHERQKRAQKLVGDARAQVDTALALLDSISDYEETAVLASREEMVVELSQLLHQLGIMERTEHLSRNGEIPLQMNRFVEREIQSFQTVERARFLAAYERSGSYIAYLKERFRQENMPENLAWLAFIESEFKARALSRARALGLWQFIASTGYRYGLTRDRWVDQRMDFVKATDAAIAYLHDLHELFGDWNTALAAYNSGEGRVSRIINRQRNDFMDDFWDLYIQLPSETARYVPRFHAVLQIVSDPQKFGFTDLPEPKPPLVWDSVLVARQMKLSDIAARLGVATEDLEALNPHLRSWITPEYEFALRVPKGRGQQMAALVESVPETKAPELPEYVIHRVRRGETLSQIADQYRTSVQAIQMVNNIRNSRLIRDGQRLRVPTRAARSNPRPQPTVTPDGSKIHVVQAGDTLWDLSQRYNATVPQLRQWNGLSSYQDIYPGQKLVVGTSD